MHSFPAPSPLDDAGSPVPPGRFLSNGSLTVLITSAGTGFSSYLGTRLNVWSGDRVEDREGFFVYVRDLDSGIAWPAGRRPLPRPARRYSARSSPGIFTIEREDEEVTTRMEICVDPGDPVEIRRISLANDGRSPRRMELTSFVEVCLAPAAAHAAHPAFSKLFVRTESAAGGRALLATRRPRAPDESWPWLVHALCEGPAGGIETDRARFIGRMRDAGSPLALRSDRPLSGTVGDVLDPILALRRVFEIAPGETVPSTFLLGTAPDRDHATKLVRAAAGEDPDSRFRAAGASAVRTRAEAGLSATEAEYAEEVAAAVLYGHPVLRCAPEVIRRADLPPSEVERLGMSPARPFAVAHPGAAAVLPQLVAMHRYWGALGAPIDLLILSDDPERTRDRVGAASASVKLVPVASVPPPLIDLVDAVAGMVVTGALPDLSGSGGQG